MKNKVTGGPAFSEKFKELKDLRKTIDDEMIRREVVRHIQILANQLK